MYIFVYILLFSFLLFVDGIHPVDKVYASNAEAELFINAAPGTFGSGLCNVYVYIYIYEKENN